MSSIQIDYDAGRVIALMISQNNASGRLREASIGVSWSPLIEPGRHWTEKRCRAVLSMLVSCGFVEIKKEVFGDEAMLTDKGCKYFNIYREQA